MASLPVVLVLALTCLSFVAAAPTDAAGLALRDTQDHDVMSINSRGMSDSIDTLLPRKVEIVVVPKSADDQLNKRESAGLYWSQNIGNLKLYVTNPHFGPVGPKFTNGANHINFHVDQKSPKNKWKKLVNLHIVRYSRASRECLYIWVGNTLLALICLQADSTDWIQDSEGPRTVFDNCFDDWTTALREGVAASKSVVDELLRNADPIAYAAVIVAVGVALLAALAGLGVVAVA
jgi:hypothetical protein